MSSSWPVLLMSILDGSNEADQVLKGQDLGEWLGYAETDYDDVDKDMIHQETVGGG